ncbi:MAG: hypothetical protein VX730_08695 [Pseudomonadota bacterium]|nr:hypothetical protein [Pseudomonadota bacterium]
MSQNQNPSMALRQATVAYEQSWAVVRHVLSLMDGDRYDEAFDYIQKNGEPFNGLVKALPSCKPSDIHAMASEKVSQDEWVGMMMSLQAFVILEQQLRDTDSESTFYQVVEWARGSLAILLALTGRGR